MLSVCLRFVYVAGASLYKTFRRQALRLLPESSTAERDDMDAIYLGGLVLLFALIVAVVHGCDKLGEQ